MSKWPKLSWDLRETRDLDHCQACNKLGEIDCMKSDGKLGESPLSLDRWLEHDDSDRSTAIVVVLCSGCSKKLIEPHPRLYRMLTLWEPHPGCMALCRKCEYREGVGCTHPSLKANGGEGLALTVPAPGHAIFCARGKGCHPITIFTGPVEDCSGRFEECCVD